MNEETRPVLEPIDRISEVLFGLIMVLGFTGSISAADVGQGQGQIRTLLYGAIGCNIAWGFIDAIMFLMAALSDPSATTPAPATAGDDTPPRRRAATPRTRVAAE